MDFGYVGVYSTFYYFQEVLAVKYWCTKLMYMAIMWQKDITEIRICDITCRLDIPLKVFCINVYSSTAIILVNLTVNYLQSFILLFCNNLQWLRVFLFFIKKCSCFIIMPLCNFLWILKNLYLQIMQIGTEYFH